MKAQTLKSRLDKRYAGSKTSKAYKMVMDLINKTNTTYQVFDKIIRPCSTSGSKKYTTNLDYTSDVKKLLSLLGVKFESGNDAVRGGLTGNYIKVLTKLV